MPTISTERETDHDLVRAWQKGDAERGQQLFARYFDEMYSFFVRRCSSDVDDLVQATFVACVRGREQFAGRSSFRTYLYTIARHELFRYRRSRLKTGKVETLTTSLPNDVLTSISSRLGRKHSIYMLKSVMSSLEMDEQLMLELRYWEELSVQELAEIFGLGPETLRTRLYRLRAKLRQGLAEFEANKNCEM